MLPAYKSFNSLNSGISNSYNLTGLSGTKQHSKSKKGYLTLADIKQGIEKKEDTKDEKDIMSDGTVGSDDLPQQKWKQTVQVGSSSFMSKGKLGTNFPGEANYAGEKAFSNNISANKLIEHDEMRAEAQKSYVEQYLEQQQKPSKEDKGVVNGQPFKEEEFPEVVPYGTAELRKERMQFPFRGIVCSCKNRQTDETRSKNVMAGSL